MASFLNQRLTNLGWDALSMALGGGRLTFFKMQAGSGTIANDAAIMGMTSLVAPVTDIAINKYAIEGDGQITLFGNIASRDLTAGFTFRELGVFATIESPVVGKGGVPTGPNISITSVTLGGGSGKNIIVPTPTPGTSVLYSYCNAYDLSDYIPGSGETTDLVNTVQVTIKIDESPDVIISIVEGEQMAVTNIGPPTVGPGPWSYTEANVAYLKRLVQGPGMLLSEDANTITIAQRQLTTDLDLYVANGNPDISPNFSSIQKAMDYLGQYIIPTNIKARIHVLAGTYDSATTILIDHPNSQCITLQGPQNNTITGTGIGTITGSTKNWSVPITGLSSTTQFNVNDYAIIDDTNDASSNNEGLLHGVFKVTAKTSNTVTLKVPNPKTSFSVTGINSVRITPISAILRITTVNTAALIVGPYGIGLWQYMVVIPQTAPTGPETLSMIRVEGQGALKFIGATGWNTVMNSNHSNYLHGIRVSGSVFCLSCCSTDNQIGFLSAAGGALIAQACHAAYCSEYGFWTQSGSTSFILERCYSTANDMGLVVSGSGHMGISNSVPPGYVDASLSGTWGVWCSADGSLQIATGGATVYPILHVRASGQYDVMVSNFGLVSNSSRITGTRVFNIPVGSLSSTGGLIN